MATLSKSNDVEEQYAASRKRAVPWPLIYAFPWWLFFLIALGIYIAFQINADATYSRIFSQLSEGIGITLQVAGFGYLLAISIGLVVGLIRAAPPRPGKGLIGGLFSFLRLVLYNVATLYVEVMRGLPMLIVIVMTAFVLIPYIRDDVLEPLLNIEQIDWMGSSVPVATLAIAFAYGAFMSETFRAGIQSIERGQIEAARALGLSYIQVMRFVVLPQAIRRILPPLGNDFVAMIKDSSLVSILGIRDVTQIAKLSSGSSFLYQQTYFTVALIYLLMTLLGSRLVRLMERYLQVQGR
jgi:ABC-type amino acid transport system permease subunit